MVIIYTNYDGLDVYATYQVSCKSVQWFWRISERFITYMGMAAILVMGEEYYRPSLHPIP